MKRNFTLSICLLLCLIPILHTTAFAGAIATDGIYGVEVTGYDKSQNYLNKMIQCAEDGSPYAVMIGSIYEKQRNLKIETENLPYPTTDHFGSFDAAKTIELLFAELQPEPVVEAPVVSTKPQVMYYTEAEIKMVARLLYAECRGVASKTEKACVVWTICNRVDTNGYGKKISSVVQAKNQFAYSSSNPVWPELYELAKDVLARWNAEKNGSTDVGRVLPSNYLWFAGDGTHNYFRNAYKGGTRWNYSLPSPYEN